MPRYEQMKARSEKISYTRQIKCDDKEFNLKKPLIIAAIFIVVMAVIFSFVKMHGNSVSLAIKDFFRVNQNEALVLSTDENVAVNNPPSFFENLPLFKFFVKTDTNNTIEVTASETNSKLTTSIKDVSDNMFENFTNTSRITREALSPFFNNSPIQEENDTYSQIASSKVTNEANESKTNINLINNESTLQNNIENNKNSIINNTVNAALESALNKTNIAYAKEDKNKNDNNIESEKTLTTQNPFYDMLKPKTTPPVKATMKPSSTTSYGRRNTVSENGTFQNNENKTFESEEVKKETTSIKRTTVVPKSEPKKSEEYKTTIRVVRTPDKEEIKPYNITNNITNIINLDTKLINTKNNNLAEQNTKNAEEKTVKTEEYKNSQTVNRENTEYNKYKNEYKNILNSTSQKIISSAMESQNNDYYKRILSEVSNTQKPINGNSKNYEQTNSVEETTSIPKYTDKIYSDILSKTAENVISSAAGAKINNYQNDSIVTNIKNNENKASETIIERNIPERGINQLSREENNVIQNNEYNSIIQTNIYNSANNTVTRTGLEQADNNRNLYPQRYNNIENKAGIYLVEYNEKLGTITLVFRKREFGKNPDLEEAILSLLKGASDEENRENIISCIPKSTKLIDVFRDKDTVYLNFSGDFEYNPLGDAGMLVQIYQFVYTATQFSGINKVIFLIDGMINETIGSEGAIENKPFMRLERPSSILNAN